MVKQSVEKSVEESAKNGVKKNTEWCRKIVWNGNYDWKKYIPELPHHWRFKKEKCKSFFYTDQGDWQDISEMNVLQRQSLATFALWWWEFKAGCEVTELASKVEGGVTIRSRWLHFGSLIDEDAITKDLMKLCSSFSARNGMRDRVAAWKESKTKFRE